MYKPDTATKPKSKVRRKTVQQQLQAYSSAPDRTGRYGPKPTTRKGRGTGDYYYRPYSQKT